MDRLSSIVNQPKSEGWLSCVFRDKGELISTYLTSYACGNKQSGEGGEDVRSPIHPVQASEVQEYSDEVHLN